tara:strand:+ start:2175 stop:2309 length:135 start_codon:yes stop_codon:yes gene_type:complete
LVPGLVIEMFEIIDVDEEQAQMVFVPGCPAQFSGEVLMQASVVG